MSSNANKEQFLKQFEHIVEGIKQNRMKVSRNLVFFNPLKTEGILRKFQNVI
jgi:hypothetical protein